VNETVKVTAREFNGYTFKGWSGASTSDKKKITVTMDESKTLVAIFTQVIYTLRAAVNPANSGAVFINGTALAGNASQNVGSKVIVWAKEAEGYGFTEWSGAGFTDENRRSNPATIDVTESGMTITANFRPGPGSGNAALSPICTLTVDRNPEGGSVSLAPDRTIYNIGESAIATAKPENGYKFARWSGTAVTETDTMNTVTVFMDGNKTLTANFQWQGITPPPPPPDSTKKLFTVNVSSAGTGATGGGSYEEGATVNITAGAEPSGYQFKNWTSTDSITFESAERASTSFIMPGKAVTVTAVFERQSGGDSSSTSQYLVTISSAGNGATGGGGYEVGATVNITAGIPPDGQRFKNWTSTSNGVTFNDANSAATSFAMPANAVTVTANFEVIKYGVTVSGGTISGGANSGSFAAGETVFILAGTAPARQRFKNWSTTSSDVIFGDPNNTSTWFSMPANTVTVMAVFETIYTVTVSAGTGSTGGGSYAAGDTVRITAGTPPDGQRFKNWTTDDGVIFGNANNTSTSFTMPTMAVTVTAVFEAIPPDTYAVTVSSVGTGATGGGSYAAGATVSITAGTPPSGQQFKNWTTMSNGVTFANDTKDTTTFTMPANAVTVTAVFEQQVVVPPSDSDTTFTDVRDGKVYKKVKIGNQTWMAENLNYRSSYGSSWCYSGSTDSCNKYGMLYDWAAAMDVLSYYNNNTWSFANDKHRGVCPIGWHLPSSQEWTTLAETVGDVAGKKLKSKNGWSNNGNGTDEFGFSALPSGLNDDGYFYNIGDRSYWWTRSESVSRGAYHRRIYYDSDNLDVDVAFKYIGFSVRCLQD